MDNVVTLIREGKIEEAEAELNMRQAEAPDNADWQYGHGLLLEAKGMLDEANEAYQQAIEIDGEHVDAIFRLAYNLDLYGEDEDAIELYQVLTEQTPAHVNALLNLAVIYEDHDCYHEAHACVERVLAENPNHARARLFMKDIQSSLTMHYDENQERSRAKRDAILDTPVSDFELSVRSRNCLKKMNIHTLGDLLRITESELLSYKNFGETSLNEIKAMLKQKGLQLGQLRDEVDGTLTTTQLPISLEVQTDAPPTGIPEIFARTLSEVEFSSRSRKCLQRLGLTTVGELVMCSEAELLASKNFGQTSLTEIKEKLAEFSLSLREVD